MARILYAAFVTCALASTPEDEALVLLQTQAKLVGQVNGTLVNDAASRTDVGGCLALRPCTNYYEDAKYSTDQRMSQSCCCGNGQTSSLNWANKCSESKKRRIPAIPKTCTIEVDCNTHGTSGGYQYSTTSSNTLDTTGPPLSCFRNVRFQGCQQVIVYDDDAGDWFSEDQHVTMNEGNGWGAGNSNCCDTEDDGKPQTAQTNKWCSFKAPWDLMSDVKKIEFKACGPIPAVPAEDTTNLPSIKWNDPRA